MEILSAEGIGELGNREIEVWGIKCRGIRYRGRGIRYNGAGIRYNGAGIRYEDRGILYRGIGNRGIEV